MYEVLFACVVLFVGVPAMTRNATAVALVLSWMGGQLAYLSTGDSLPLRFYMIADIAVIAVIYGKMTAACADKVYESCWHQLKCMVTDLTPQDRIIVFIFLLLVWPLYVLNIGDFYKWWALWGLTIIQFLLAGSEAYHSWREAKRADSITEPDIPSSGSAFSCLVRTGDYG